MNVVYRRSLVLVCITGWHFSTEGSEPKTAFPVSPQHFLHWLKAMMKGQWWANKGKGEREKKNHTNQALQTVGCVTTHRFNNSPPGTKAAWLWGRWRSEKNKERNNLTHAHGYFSNRETHNILNRVILAPQKNLTTSSAVGLWCWCGQIKGATCDLFTRSGNKGITAWFVSCFIPNKLLTTTSISS